MRTLQAMVLGAAVSMVFAQSTPPDAQPEIGATIPGVTLWVHDLGDERFNRRPVVVEGQTPNVYAVFPNVQFADGFDSAFGRLENSFAGEVRGWLRVDRAGEYVFRLECDDGAVLRLDGTQVLDLEEIPAFAGEAGAVLEAGLHRLSIPFYEDQGKFNLRLSWRPPGAADFTLVPTENLRTEAGQTFATSPGPKRWYYADKPLAPGDGRPLEGVHPGFTLEDFRGPDFRPAVGGMAFLPDGRLAVSTWDHTGAVYLLRNLDGAKPGGVEVHRFASGLGEPLGIAVVNGEIVVTQKQEVTRLRDTDGDGVADVYEPIVSGWAASHNYHEFSFNLLPHDGALFVTTSVPLKSGDTNYTPGSAGAFAVNDGPGSCLRIDPASGAYVAIATGLRAPNGMGMGPDGLILCCDNQGDWLPSSRMNVIRPGGFYGHQLTPDGTEKSDPPLAWFPHGEIGNSPTEPVLVRDGPYAGDVLVGDVTYGGIQRVAVECVDGVWQGAVFRLTQGLEAGVNRLAWGPDGCLYVGGIGSNGNWNHKEKKFGLQRLRPNGTTPFEMRSIRARADGLMVQFTLPADAASERPETYQVRSWRYEPTVRYGGPKVDVKSHRITRVDRSTDGRAVFLQIEGLREGSVVHVRLRDLKGAGGESAWSTEGWLTLNRLGSKSGPDFALAQPRPVPFAHRPPNAVVLVDESGAPGLRDGSGGVCPWPIERGEALATPKRGDAFSAMPLGDCVVHAEWLCPPGGDPMKQLNANSGIKLQGRYEVQILGTPGAHANDTGVALAGSIYRLRAPSRNASRGPGVWQSYDIEFTAPKWEGARKISNARMSLWWNGELVHDNVEIETQTGVSPAEAPGPHPLTLQAHASNADGPVRFRNIWVVPR